MIRHCLLSSLIFFTGSSLLAQRLQDPVKNNLVDRIVSGISKSYALNDSIKNELSGYFYTYCLSFKKIRSERKGDGQCFGDPQLDSLRNNFLQGLNKKFGEEVYDYYRKFIRGCVLPDRKKENMLNESQHGL
jgi:hypothetical protein